MAKTITQEEVIACVKEAITREIAKDMDEIFQETARNLQGISTFQIAKAFNVQDEALSKLVRLKNSILQKYC